MRQPKPLEKPKIYEVENRVTHEKRRAAAYSADEACRDCDWMIGDCYVKEAKIES